MGTPPLARWWHEHTFTAGHDVLGDLPLDTGTARGELAAAYSNGTLNRPAFLASVNRVIALRQTLR
jgi:hypothetical protein